MPHAVKRIYIMTMRESVKGLSYWVQIDRDDGGTISPYMSYHMDRALYTAAEWADFFGIKPEVLQPMEEMGLTQDMIDAAYKEASMMIEGLQVAIWNQQKKS